MNPQQLKLYAITDRSWLKPGETLTEVVETLLKAGVTCVQLREKEAEDAFILQEAQELNALCRRYGVPFLVNDRPDLAQTVGADGVHVGREDIGLTEARKQLGANAVLGGSAHTVEEALAAQAAGADYLGCGAVFGSGTKHNVSQMSLETLTAICQAVDIPVVAIGGVNLDNLSLLAGTGIAGVAVISGLFALEDKAAAAQGFLQQLEGLI
ncbi:MAG: thiamine phosphate synthase [Eubacteriales bacterium]|nr:thiamine phosphate synthase [Eubacteriales bacterium]